MMESLEVDAETLVKQSSQNTVTLLAMPNIIKPRYGIKN